MEKVLYTLLLLGSAAGAGLAAIVAYLQLKLSRLDGRTRWHAANAITKVGIAVTQGILTWRLAENGIMGPVQWYGFAYLGGLITVSFGLGLQIRDVIADVVRAEMEEKK